MPTAMVAAGYAWCLNQQELFGTVDTMAIEIVPQGNLTPSSGYPLR